jgi:serine protease
MRRGRPVLFLPALAVAAVVVVATRGLGRAQTTSPLDILVGVGLPGIDRGQIVDETRVPGSPDAARRHGGLAPGAALRERNGPGGARIIASKLIIRFRDGLSIAERQAAVTLASPGAVLARPSDADFDVVGLDASDDSEAAALRLSQRADVEYAQPAHRLHTQLVPNDPLYKTNQWNLPLIDLERAWDIQPQAGSAIIVAVIDTGVAYANATMTATLVGFTVDGVLFPPLGRVTIPYAAAPQLGASSRFVAPRDFVCGGTTPLDFDGHGTHVSGTIGQSTNDGVGTAGVAFNVRIMPVKVLASNWDVALGCADSEGGSDDDVARGIRYAVDNGAKILNLSLGADGPAGSAPVVEDAIKYAVGKGAFVAIAAGNSFEDGNPMQVLAEIASRVDGAVSVAAVDPQKKHAYYSSSGAFVELAAPGGSARGFGPSGAIWQQTFDPSYSDTFLQSPARFSAPRFDVFAYVPYQGTSQATPHVSGVAAMLMQQGIVDPAVIEKVLETFATDLGDPGRDALYGFGLIEARSALRGLGVLK